MIAFRPADVDDAFPLMRLYQLAASDLGLAPIFLDLRRLSARLGDPAFAWVVAQDGGELTGVAAAELDRSLGLAKLDQFLRLPAASAGDGDLALAGLLGALAELVRKAAPDTEILYTTTRILPLADQRATLRHGYKLIGIAPGVRALDPSSLNGIAALMLKPDFVARRCTEFSLHPALKAFYDITARECGLGPLKTAAVPDAAPPPGRPVSLELIEAEEYVKQRFAALKSKGLLSSNFYPFQTPNTALSDAKASVELFVRTMPSSRFAVIIGEHLGSTTDPVALYQSVGSILRDKGITYVEVVSDAGDVLGIESMLQAGFVPCVYFPGMKPHGKLRRDYVAFSRSTEKPWFPTAGLTEPYVDYLRAYYRILAQKLFPEIGF